MKKDNKNELDTGVSIISPGVEIKGDITTSGSVRVDGRVVGNIQADGVVTIGERGEVKGDLKAVSIIIGGKVTGTIISQERLQLEAHAQVEGDVFASKLIVEEGARFVGKSSMTQVKAGPDGH